MSTINRLDLLLRLLDRVHSGNIAHLLSMPGFDAPLHLAKAESLVERLMPFVEDPTSNEKDPELRRLDSRNLALLAQRLLLGRNAPDLSRLAGLWRANGTPAEVVQIAVEAAQAAQERWPSRPAAYSSAHADPVAYSSAHADFVRALGEIECRDSYGPLGRAVTLSRYQGVGDLDHPRPQAHLAGETRHIGFPVLLGDNGANETAFRAAAWVVPGEGVGECLTEADSLDSSGRRRGRGTKGSLGRARGAWRQLCSSLPGGENAADDADLGLPDWFLLAVARHDLESLDSAKLAVALDRIARTQGRPLPAGIGFTGDLHTAGRLEEARLRPVTGIAAKLHAGREAGVFVLFACYDPSREEVTTEPGVTLVRLPEVALGDALALINTFSANLGLTEYRWQRTSTTLRNWFSLSAADGAIWSRPLPDVVGQDAVGGEAADSDASLPVGFVGRKAELNELDRWWDEARGQRRRFGLVIGDPRAGKTTLLGHWLRPSERWPRMPVWFSFLRDRTGALTAPDMEAALTEQILVRYYVVLRPGSDPGVFQRGGPLAAQCGHTQARIDVVVDGLDETSPGERREAVARLELLSGSGLLVLGSQQVAELPGPGWRRIHIRNESAGGLRDGAELVARFAGYFEQRGLGAEACKLTVESYQEGLANQVGGNLLTLKDFLVHVADDRAGLPDDPANTILTANVEEYCRLVLAEVLRGCGDISEREDLRTFLVRLAIVEERCWPAFIPEERWRLDDLLPLLGLNNNLGRWQRLVEEYAGRLVTWRRQRVHFRSTIFCQALMRAHPADQRALAERLIDQLRQPGNGPADQFTRRYAISSITRHLTGEKITLYPDEAGDLAMHLLFETTWASERLQMLASMVQPIDEFLVELAELRPLVERRLRAGFTSTDALPALDALQRTLAVWGRAIDQTRACVSQWWAVLPAIRNFPCWARQIIGAGESGPKLLFPLTGAGQPALDLGILLAPRLTGAACELADGRPGTLVCAAENGFLVRYRLDPVSSSFVPDGLVGLPVKVIKELVALDDRHVAALATDWAGVMQLFQIDVLSGVATTLENPLGGTLVAIAPLEPDAPGRPHRLLLASWVDPETRIAILDSGQDSGIPHAAVPIRAVQLLAFAPCAWGLCGGVGPGHDEPPRIAVHNLTADGQIEDVTDQKIADVVGTWFNGVCPGPHGRLGLFFTNEDNPHKGCLVTLGADGRLADDVSIPEYVPRDSEAARETDWWGSVAEYIYLGARPYVWHDRLGILFHHEVRGYFLLQPRPVTRPKQLPQELISLIPDGEDISSRIPIDGTRLSGGRCLLLFPGGGVIIEEDGQRVTNVGNPGFEVTHKSTTIREWGDDGAAVLTFLQDGKPFRQVWPVSGPPEAPSPVSESDISVRRHFRLQKEATGGIRDTPDQLGSDGTRFQVRNNQILLQGEGEPQTVTTASQLQLAKYSVETLKHLLEAALAWAAAKEEPQTVTTASQLQYHLHPETSESLAGSEAIPDHHQRFESQVLDLRRERNDWLVRIGKIIGGESSQVVRITDVRVVNTGVVWAEGPSWDVLLEEEVRCYAPVSRDWLAVGYASGRIEVVSIGRMAPPGSPVVGWGDGSGRIEFVSIAPMVQPGSRVVAVGFTLFPPEDMARYPDAQKKHLVVVAGDVLWFDLSELV